MRAILQRVQSASVKVDGHLVGQIKEGLLIFLGMGKRDNTEQVSWLVEKIIHLRIFSDDIGKMNRSIQDVHGACLVVSQFTLYANCLGGRRPSFIDNLPPVEAKILYEQFIVELKQKIGEDRVETGRFGVEMEVELINDGPATFLIEL